MCRLFFGILAADEELLERTKRRIQRDYAAILLQSDVIPFDFSDYYASEMGPGLLRQWICTEELINVLELPEIKRHTNSLELIYAEGEKRRINIDPGYVNHAKVVLATTKDFEHRLYIRDGIFEEVTLHFRRNGGFLPWPWTYPDYQSDVAQKFFLAVRESLSISPEQRNSK